MNLPKTWDEIHAMRESVERERSKRDCSYFVQEYVSIEDRDSPAVSIPFHLWPKQIGVLLSFISDRLIQILKARQLGQTWLALAYACWSMIFKPGFSVIALSKTEDDAKELVRRVKFILSHLPQWMFGGTRWDATKESVTIYHKEPSTLQSFAASENAGRSFTASLLLLDEWAFQQWAREIWRAAFPSINRPTGGQVIGLSTIERGTLFEELWLGDNGFKKIFLPWTTDPRRTQSWYEETKKQLGDSTLAEYPATVEEAFAIAGGSYFSQFRPTVHLKPETVIPDWYGLYRTIDYGLDMLACYWVYIDERGHARIYRELCKSNLTISEAAYEILKATGAKVPDGVDEWKALTREQKQKIAETQIEDIRTTYAPPDLFNTSQHTGKSNAIVWGENGINLTKTKNPFEAGCVAMSEWLTPIQVRDEQTGHEYLSSRLTITEDAAPKLVHSLVNIQKDKHNPKVYAKEPHELTHQVDSLRYFCTEYKAPAYETARRVPPKTYNEYMDKTVFQPIMKRAIHPGVKADAL